MKHFKFFLLTIVALTICFSFSSCSKDDDDDTEVRYIVKIDDSIGSTSVINVDLTMFEYNNNGEKINSQVWKAVKSGESKEFIADPSTVKVKVYLTLSSALTSSSSKWVQKVYYLNKGTTIISIEENSLLGYNEP